jgi:signal transduction histidine kinase
MLASVAAVATLAFWDEQRESAAALDDFAEDQTTLAASVGAELGTQLSAIRRNALLVAESLEEGRKVSAAAVDGYTSYALRPAASPPVAVEAGVLLQVPVSMGRTLDLVVPPMKLLEGGARIERPGLVRLFLLGPGDERLRSTDGSFVQCEPIRRALTEERTSSWLVREDAVALGLRPRRAAVGLAHVDAGPLGRWAVAVVTSAERVRDRERRASVRLTLGVLLTAGLVLLFGTAALRRQRRALLLERELALAGLERRRDAELVHASRVATLGTLAMGIAHEVSTPLGVIAGRAEQLLPKVAGDERARRSVGAILEQADRIRRVVRSFLDIVRGGAPTLADAPPLAVLDGAVSLVRHRFAAARVTLVQREPGVLPTIHGDVALLQQALVNLLLNACDACVGGGLVAASVESDGESVTFTVVDDGRGITSEAAARATEAFFTTKAPGAGSGLGLAITSEIVKIHRGKLALTQAYPRGTRASITLPLPAREGYDTA